MTIPDRRTTRTGQRSALRGPTVHVYPLEVSKGGLPFRFRLEAHQANRRRKARQHPARRGGPVAGCRPGACWHVLPHWAWQS